MGSGEIFLIIFFNCIIFAGFYFTYTRIVERRIRHLKADVQELEDLVAAIIEEFEEVAAINIKDSLSVNDTAEPDVNGENTSLIPDGETAPAILSQPEAAGEMKPSPELNEGIKLQDSSSPDHGMQPTDPRHRRILELWKNGIPVEEIARQLGTGRGEVQLVLGIYQKM